MNITILTIFPGQLNALADHWDERHPGSGVRLRILDIRDMVKGSFRAVDDSPYGGGAGMILRCEPVFRALEALGILSPEGERLADPDSVRVAALSPAGKVFHQQDARRLSVLDHLVLICGHYEGMDQRIYDYCDELLSIGDFVLSGGELAAFSVAESIDAAGRQQLPDA